MCLAARQEGQHRAGGACGRSAAAVTEDGHTGTWAGGAEGSADMPCLIAAVVV